MADRIVILAANPGRVRTIVENKLPRPRDYRSQQLLRLVDYLHEIITHSEMPDPPAPRRRNRAARVYEPLPDALPSEVVGLLEYLDARGGKEDVYRIAGDTNREFGHVINVVKAAEMLDLVDTPKRMVVLEPDGKAFVTASPQDRQAVWRQHLLELRLFKDVYEAIKRRAGDEIDKDFVLELIVMNMPQENSERMFQTFLHWTRFRRPVRVRRGDGEAVAGGRRWGKWARRDGDSHDRLPSRLPASPPRSRAASAPAPPPAP